MIQTAKKAACEISAMASAIDTGRGHARNTLRPVSSPPDAFRTGMASAAPAANAANEMTTVTGFGPAGGRVPATPNPRNTRFPV